MKELVETALNVLELNKASYGDIRVVETIEEIISVKNGVINVLKRNESMGFGIRVIKNGAWGFASSSEVSTHNVQKIASTAVKIAEASATLKKEDVILGEAPKIIDKYITKVELDPFTVSTEEKINLLLTLDTLMRKVKGIKISDAMLTFIKINKLFAST